MRRLLIIKSCSKQLKSSIVRVFILFLNSASHISQNQPTQTHPALKKIKKLSSDNNSWRVRCVAWGAIKTRPGSRLLVQMPWLQGVVSLVGAL